MTTIRYGYARWLAWLYGELPKSLAEPPGERVTRERIKAYAGVLGQSMKSASVASYIAWLSFACCYMFPAVAWDWLREVKTRIETNAPKRPLQAVPFDSVTLQDLGLKMMDEAVALLINLDRTDQRSIREVIELYRDGRSPLAGGDAALMQGKRSSAKPTDRLAQCAPIPSR